MAKDLRDSRRKNKFTMSRRIPIDIYKGKHEMRGKINREALKEG